MSQDKKTEYQKATKIAARFGVHPSTVLRWQRTGLLPGVRTLQVGKRTLFNSSDVDVMVNNSETAGGAK